mmetsp:Transcript_135971/g.290613  ORF Transcript_135971/g.290613 Transcript_135971/m.290613 type:complete len:237 (+) Transcript_135971:73-783(+)
MAGSTRKRAASAVSQSSKRTKSFVPAPSSCLRIAWRSCAVPTVALPWLRAHSMESSRTCFASAVKGISIALPPSPWPAVSSKALRATGKVTPNCSRARAPRSEASAMMPTTSISAPTWSRPSFRDSACAIITAFMDLPVKRSKMALHATERRRVCAPMSVPARPRPTSAGAEAPAKQAEERHSFVVARRSTAPSPKSAPMPTPAITVREVWKRSSSEASLPSVRSSLTRGPRKGPA